MRTASDCTRRAEECRRLAELAAKPEDFGHFLEMAEAWELLAKQRRAEETLADSRSSEEQLADEQLPGEERLADVQLGEIFALADAIANRRNN
jgi:hypothetical protein